MLLTAEVQYGDLETTAAPRRRDAVEVLLLSQSLDNSTDANTSAAPGNNATTVIYAVDVSVAGVINSEDTSAAL